MLSPQGNHPVLGNGSQCRSCRWNVILSNVKRSRIGLLSVALIGGAIGGLIYVLSPVPTVKMVPLTAREQPPPSSISKKKPPVVVESRPRSREDLGFGKFPEHIVRRMRLVDVDYLGFDGLTHRGQIVVDSSLGGEVKQIFRELRSIGYPIKKVVPISRYGWDDKRSMADNNTSGFNYRRQVTPRGKSRVLSNHAFGRAIDLNPLLNPYVSSTGQSSSTYDPLVRGTLTRESAAVKVFTKRGWKWGGNWTGSKDYQHFEKP